jgi:hypothetical protein
LKTTIGYVPAENQGPAAYKIESKNMGPLFSMGSRFDSDVRSKDHLRPKKKDGPGPGSYSLPSGLNVYKSTSKDKEM